MNSRARRGGMIITTTDNDPPKLTHTAERPLRRPRFLTDVFGVSILAAVYAGMIAYSAAALFGAALFGAQWGAGVPDSPAAFGVLAFSGVGFAVTLYRAIVVFDRPIADWEQVVFQDVWIDGDDEPENADDPEPLRVSIPCPTRAAPVEFTEPRVGEFAGWVAAVLRDAADDRLGEREKTTLSQNTGVSRGWPVDQYRNMRAALEMVGWLRRRRNMAPVLTQAGTAELRAWVRNEQNVMSE